MRQKVIDNYFVDFYIPDAGLIIELDGLQYYEQNGLIEDKIQTEKLNYRELTVILIPAYFRCSSQYDYY